MGRTNSIKEEIKLRRITMKKINEIERLQTEVKESEESEIETIKDKLFDDLNMKKGFGIVEIK